MTPGRGPGIARPRGVIGSGLIVVKKELAETLLAKIMGWSDAEKATERARLESFASYKYDEYQQFGPGLRFMESLALWLRQFDDGNERHAAYEFVQQRLVFMSRAELNHLVELCYPTIIRRRLIVDTASEIGLSPHRVKAIVKTPSFRARLRRTLVLGLSDGARTDHFRRVNPQDMSNEQVFHAYDISDAKAGNMVKKLASDLAKIHGREPTENEKTFQYVVLLDDFSGSGITAIRQEQDGTWDGKIPRIVAQLEAEDGLGSAIASSGVRVVIILYVASEQAAKYIREWLPKLPFRKGSVEFEIVSELSSRTRLDDVTDAKILSLAQQDRYFDADQDDEHAAVGGKSKRLGFAEGRLPLVLSHNTPNNSIFLLWAEDVQDVRGLFPRVSRHRKR